MNGYIEICIDGLKTRVDFQHEDGISGCELVEYFIGLMRTQTFANHTIKESLKSVLEDLEHD